LILGKNRQTPGGFFWRTPHKNGDGKVDIDEFMGRATAEETKKRREKQFAEMDKDSDKAVTLEEMKAWQKAREAKVEKAPKKEPKKAKQ
jgi:Ca2+-binding EF-hand superfamily protein